MFTLFSKGQAAFGHEANYLPLYSSDTADDSENSSENSDSNVDSDHQYDTGNISVMTNGIIEDNDVIDELVAQEVDLMKPLVVDVDDEEYDEEPNVNYDEEERGDDDFGMIFFLANVSANSHPYK